MFSTKFIRLPTALRVVGRSNNLASLGTTIKIVQYQPASIQTRDYSSESLRSDCYRMRFVQFLRKNEAKRRIGVCSDDGSTITDLTDTSCFPSDMVEFIKAEISLQDVMSKVCNGIKLSANDVQLLSPVVNPEKIICIGLNYKGHCEEQNKVPPSEPMFFSKYASALTGPTGDVVAHNISDQIDWEVELAVVIGKQAKKVPKEKAFDYVFGYCVAQDISARDWQKIKNGGQFLIGKSMDTFCPLGPSIVHKSLIPDPHNLIIRCSVNKVEKQCGNTSELIFRIDDIIHRLSQSITLKPGDVILTGTPAGVGMHRKPPEFLKPGDVIESEIESVGKLINTVVADN